VPRTTTWVFETYSWVANRAYKTDPHLTVSPRVNRSNMSQPLVGFGFNPLGSGFAAPLEEPGAFETVEMLGSPVQVEEAEEPVSEEPPLDDLALAVLGEDPGSEQTVTADIRPALLRRWSKVIYAGLTTVGPSVGENQPLALTD